jgi:hypothetical protein
LPPLLSGAVLRPPNRRSASIQLMAKPTLITDFEKDGSFTIGAGETSQSEREFRNGWREPKWIIHYNGHIQVDSSLLNVVLHDEPHIET